MPELIWNTDLYNQQHNFVYQYGEDVIEWLDPQPGENILDVGCGTGQLTDKIRQAGTHVTGIDASPDMVRKAMENYDGIEFFVKNASDFGFDKSFDAVFSNATLHWISRQKQALQCIYDVLENKGRFVFEMGGKGNIQSIHMAIKKSMMEMGLGEHIPGDLNYFPSVAEQATLLEEVGFSVSKLAYFKRPTRLEGEEGMELWITQFCGFFFKTVPADVKEAIISDSVNKLRRTNYRNGQWTADYVRLRVKAIKEK